MNISFTNYIYLKYNVAHGSGGHEIRWLKGKAAKVRGGRVWWSGERLERRLWTIRPVEHKTQDISRWAESGRNITQETGRPRGGHTSTTSRVSWRITTSTRGALGQTSSPGGLRQARQPPSQWETNMSLLRGFRSGNSQDLMTTTRSRRRI